MEKIVIDVPNFNQDGKVEKTAQEIGAYIGASVAAAGCAAVTGVSNLFYGLWAGASNTFNNGKTELERRAALRSSNTEVSTN